MWMRLKCATTFFSHPLLFLIPLFFHCFELVKRESFFSLLWMIWMNAVDTVTVTVVGGDKSALHPREIDFFSLRSCSRSNGDDAFTACDVMIVCLHFGSRKTKKEKFSGRA